jgi:DNA-binding NtrC family response regulator
MTASKSVLILDDQADMRDAIARGFSENSDYHFQVETAESPADCIAKRIDYRPFDVYVVDLDMEPGVGSFFGYPFIRALDSTGSVIVVYSVHGHSVETIVKAMRSGATDFLVKGGACRPDQVADRVVQLLRAREAEEERHRLVASLAERMGPQWQQDYPGKVLVIVDDQVILAADTRLQAIVEYRKRRREQPSLPEEPELWAIASTDV